MYATIGQLFVGVGGDPKVVHDGHLGAKIDVAIELVAGVKIMMARLGATKGR